MAATLVPTVPAAGLVSPHPLGATLPALYQEDSFTQRFCAGLDEALAPVIAMLDCFEAYLDPGTTPPDMLDWLASWMGLAASSNLPVARKRRLVARAAQLHAWRGTPRAVRGLVELATGLPAELEESGGTGWSRRAGAALPGSNRPSLVVRVRADSEPIGTDQANPGAAEEADPAETAGALDEDLLRRLLELVIPCHLPWRLEVVR